MIDYQKSAKMVGILFIVGTVSGLLSLNMILSNTAGKNQNEICLSTRKHKSAVAKSIHYALSTISLSNSYSVILSSSIFLCTSILTSITLESRI